VRRNRQPVERAEAIGLLAERVLAGRSLSAADRLSELVRLLASGTDAEFQRHCTVGRLCGGKLTVLVDDPSWVRPMRERWLVHIKQLLGEARGQQGVSSVRFEAGRGELGFTRDGETE
jgi:hypothetical protein